jgi:hypothetical protein
VKPDVLSACYSGTRRGDGHSGDARKARRETCALRAGITAEMPGVFVALWVRRALGEGCALVRVVLRVRVALWMRVVLWMRNWRSASAVIPSCGASYEVIRHSRESALLSGEKSVMANLVGMRGSVLLDSCRLYFTTLRILLADFGFCCPAGVLLGQLSVGVRVCTPVGGPLRPLRNSWLTPPGRRVTGCGRPRTGDRRQAVACMARSARHPARLRWGGLRYA